MSDLAFRVGWVLWAVWGLTEEGWALWFRKGHPDTLTAQLRFVLGHPLGPTWFVGVALLIWLFVHLLLYRFIRGV
jgi:hypothetical protein